MITSFLGGGGGLLLLSRTSTEQEAIIKEMSTANAAGFAAAVTNFFNIFKFNINK